MVFVGQQLLCEMITSICILGLQYISLEKSRAFLELCPIPRCEGFIWLSTEVPSRQFTAAVLAGCFRQLYINILPREQCEDVGGSSE